MTKSISRRNVGAILLASVAMGVLSGCAAVGKVSPEGDKEALKKRAQEYWALVKANDRVKAWNYEELSKDPNGSLEGYLKRGGITFDAVEVREVKSLEGDRATVEVFTRYSVPLVRLKNMETVSQDEWRRIDGAWYHVLRRSVMFPGEKS
nr:hypothetical protein [uncultured Acidovorax sp.]